MKIDFKRMLEHETPGPFFAFIIVAIVLFMATFIFYPPILLAIPVGCLYFLIKNGYISF